MNWHARMIAADLDFDGAPLLRTEFPLDRGHGRVVRANLRSRLSESSRRGSTASEFRMSC